MEVFDEKTAKQWAKSWGYFANGQNLGMLRLTINAMHGNYTACKNTSPSRAHDFLAAHDHLQTLLELVEELVLERGAPTKWYAF